MDNTSDTLPFNDMQSWNQSKLSADRIWAQVKQALKAQEKQLPLIPRRPDVRVVLDNATGGMLHFLNPGNYTKGVPEDIKSDEAVMVMPWGDTLEEQFENAAALVREYDLIETGLTKEFLSVLGDYNTSLYMKEAYGPAPFEGQSKKLEPVQWGDAETPIIPVKSDVCAYGARAPEPVAVFLNQMLVFVKGTNTSAEMIEGEGMCVEISVDWQTKEETTKPIVPSVAKGFYGNHYDSMATVSVDPRGNVQEIDLKDGNVIRVAPTEEANADIASANERPLSGFDNLRHS